MMRVIILILESNLRVVNLMKKSLPLMGKEMNVMRRCSQVQGKHLWMIRNGKRSKKNRSNNKSKKRMRLRIRLMRSMTR